MTMSIFIILLLMIVAASYQLGFKAGTIDYKARVNKRVDKVLKRVSGITRSEFNQALADIINEEKK